MVRAVIAGVASEDLRGEEKTITIDDEAHHALLAIGALITRMAALGFGIESAQPLKMR